MTFALRDRGQHGSERQIRSTRTTCPYCGVGCGVLATPDGSSGAAIAGDPDHPANFGRLCSKGSALGETLSLENRLLYPMVRCSNGAMEQIAWTDALDHVAHRFAHIIARDGPGAVALYLSGQLLTEDYYVANKLMKGFIGSANVDTNSRLCMASSVAGHRRAFGADTVPGVYEDLDEADLLVLVGSNAAWCHPVLFQRMIANKQRRGACIVVIDPRKTDTAEDADLFLGLKPGTDTALFSGLLVHLADNGALDRDYIECHTSGFDDALARARSLAGSAAATALATGLSEQDVAAFFRMFAATPRVVTLYSQGINQSAQGTDKVNAIINCHLATGRIGKIGASPFSLTGQPNAMGGREVGGLANQLAAHMNFTPPDIDRVRRFWKAPRIATHEGLKAVQMFEAIGRGEIKALWVMGTNPAVSLPDADAARDALKKLELFVVSENVLSNDTVAAGAHVLLPALAWGEKSGTVTNSERRISRQRAFRAAPGEARPDWWIISEVAKRLGFGSAFDYGSAATIFREHAALSAFENNGSRDFDIGALSSVSDEGFDGMSPILWPFRFGDIEPIDRFFSKGGFFGNDRKARFVAPEPPALRTETRAERPLRLNTGRIRDQWHTMTRTGTSPRLGAHLPEPFVEIHPDDAARYGLADGAFARVTTDHGQCTLKVVVTPQQQRGMLFAPIHWSEATASAARVGALVAPLTDPFSGQPEAKATPASITPYEYVFRGFVLSRSPLKLPDHAWWARVAVRGGVGYLIADNADLKGWSSWLRSVAGSELAEYSDFGGGVYRAASLIGEAIGTCLFLGPARDAGDWDVVKELFAADALTDDQWRMLLSGKPAHGLASSGPVVCACFGVGRATICDAIAAGARSATELGMRLKAGTNCGSCIPELKRLIAQSGTADHECEKRAVANSTPDTNRRRALSQLWCAACTIGEHMKHKKFGKTGHDVSVIGQGTWYIDRGDRKAAVEALRRGIDLGMTHIDTAEMYGDAEVVIAEAIAGRRDDVYLVSKVLPGNASRRGTITACERSLARLKTDRLDCYLLHWRGNTPLSETVAAFEQLISAGKIRSWGVSNFDADDLNDLLEVAGEGKIACNQVLYHLRERAIEHAVIPWCAKHDVAVVAYSPFGHNDFPDPRSKNGEVLQAVAKRHGVSARQVALGFLTRESEVFAIPKASNAEHAADNAAAGDLAFSADDLAALDRAFPLGPKPRSLPML